MIISRYFSKEVLSTMTAVTFVLLLIFLSNQFVHFLEAAAQGKFAAETVLRLMALAIPHMLGLLLPLGFYLGILLALGRLHSESEMTVLYACGVSPWRVTKIMLRIGLGLTIGVALLTLWLGPYISVQRNRLLAGHSSLGILATLYPGRFQSVGHGKRVIYVGDMNRENTEMTNVFVAQLSPQTGSQAAHPWGILSAEKGHEEVNKKTGDHYLVTEDGYRYIGTPGMRNFKVFKYHKYHVRVQEATTFVDTDPDAQSTVSLWRQRANPEFLAELQWRISLPLSICILVLIAVPISEVRPRMGKYARLLPAILIYMCYANFMFIARDWVATGKVAGWFGMWWIHLLMLVVAGLIHAWPHWCSYRLVKRSLQSTEVLA